LTHVGGDNAELLPPPRDKKLDALSQLYVLMATDSRLDSSSLMDDISAANKERERALSERIEQLQKAAEEREDGGFWGDLLGVLGPVAEVAGVIASAALVVATCGAGLPFVLAVSGLVLSSAAMTQRHTDYLGAMGCSQETSKWLTISMTIGGGLASGGAALAHGLAAGGSAVSTTQEVAAGTGYVAGAVGGVAAAGAGVATIGQADAERDAQRLQARATDALGRMQTQQQLMLALIDQLQEVKERETKNTKRITAMAALEDATMLAAAGGRA
jgi:hypothetical protein